MVMMDMALQAEMAAGIYKLPAAELAKLIHYEPVGPEVRVVIIAGWVRGGLLPSATIDTMVPAAPPTNRIGDMV